MSRLLEYEAGCSSGSEDEGEDEMNTQDREFISDGSQQECDYRDVGFAGEDTDIDDEDLYGTVPGQPLATRARRIVRDSQDSQPAPVHVNLCAMEEPSETSPAHAEEDHDVPTAVAVDVPMASQSEGAPATLRDEDKGKRVRRWCFTWNNYPDNMYSLLETAQASGKVTYVGVGKEVAPSTGRPHGQGYCELKNPTGLKGIISLFQGFGIRGLHWLKCMGDAASNITYCSKDGDYRDWGTKPKGQGKRSDLDKVVEIVNAHGSLDDIVDQVPVAYIRYSAGIQKLIMMKQKKRTWPMTVYWLWGGTGVGKSREAWRLGGENMFAKDVMTEWWDGYTGQKCVILDDYRPTKRMSFAYLLRLFDRYPMQVQIKSGTAQFCSKVIFVTSPYTVEQMFANCDWIKAEDIEQMRRRVTEIHFTPGTILNFAEMIEEEAKEA